MYNAGKTTIQSKLVKYGIVKDKKEISNAKSFDKVIDLLVADEEEAIEGYNEAIEKLKELDEKEKEKLIDVLSHIRDEEKEHIDELENREIEEHE